MQVGELMITLYENDNKIAYESLKKLEEISEIEDTVYKYMDDFLEMIKDKKSFIRVRGFRLLCKNAKWDKQNKINKNIDEILDCLEDEKPTSTRQKLEAIKEMVTYKKELHEKIKKQLLAINYLNYPETMQSLIIKDTEEILKMIANKK